MKHITERVHLKLYWWAGISTEVHLLYNQSAKKIKYEIKIKTKRAEIEKSYHIIEIPDKNRRNEESKTMSWPNKTSNQK